jgi:hypothetical protein
MPFEQTVDSLESVAEDARPFYRKGADGKFNLITADSIEKLETSLGRTKTERDEAKKAAAAVKGWESLGKTPEEIQQLLQERADAETANAEKKGEWEKLKQQMADNHAKELDTFKSREGKLKGSLEKHLIDAAATAAIAELKGVPTLLLPHIRDRVKVEEKDDDFVVTVLAADRKTPQLNDKNEPMTIKELVASMREDDTFGRAFEGSGHSGGGGAGGGGGSGGGSTGLRKSQMSIKEKTAFMTEHGHEAYRALPS